MESKYIFLTIPIILLLLIQPCTATGELQKFAGIGEPFNGNQFVLNGSVITKTALNVTNYTKLVGFNGWNLTISTMGTGEKQTQQLSSLTYISANTTAWLIAFNTSANTAELFIAGNTADVFYSLERFENFLMPTSISAYFSGFYGAALWGAIWALPSAMTYIRTKNPANSAIVLGFMLSIGSFMVAELKPFAVLAMGIAVGVLLFRLLRPKQSEQ